MIHGFLSQKVSHWLSQPNCPAKPLLDYMASAGKLRAPQMGALAHYLYLLFEGKNQDLASLWQQGTFNTPADYRNDPVSANTVATFNSQPGANTWYQWALKEHPALAKHWATEAPDFDYEALTRQLFYGWTNTDYLFSLPMGAGKTWLMASIIYVNLYLHSQNPDDPRFARNFAILIPSSKKSSLLPSLRSIERFQAQWVVPDPAASDIAKQLKFEVLDAAKSGAKNNRTRNPNAQKLWQHQPFEACTGLVLVVNAEKVILDKLGDTASATLDEVEALPANELRALIGRIPNLQVHIDEVQNVAHDGIKLRQVVQGWHNAGSIHSVLGYSGTPYHETAYKLPAGEGFILKLPNISTVVYHYPLTRAVAAFLKQPTVVTMTAQTPAQIVARGAAEFMQLYGQTLYTTDDLANIAIDANVSTAPQPQLTAKLAIYCGSIARLENEIYPQLLGMGILESQILRYHGGNKEHPISPQAQAQFLALDTAASRIKVVLLVQIGKEGWDCKSLTGVILSQAGDCPTNMVLQTTCRCLREVQRGVKHPAHIWLNAENAAVLDAQLKQNQSTSIAELNAIASRAHPQAVQQTSRMAPLNLPDVQLLELKLQCETVLLEADARTEQKLSAALLLAQSRSASQRESSFGTQGLSLAVNQTLTGFAGGSTDFAAWCQSLVRHNFALLSMADFAPFEALLRAIHDALCLPLKGNANRRFDLFAPRSAVEKAVRLAFWQLRSAHYTLEELPQHAQLQLLNAANLQSLAPTAPMYPSAAIHSALLQADATGQDAAALASATADQAQAQSAVDLMNSMGLTVPPELLTRASSAQNDIVLRHKQRTLHYSPYVFAQSQFEQRFLQQALALQELQDLGLELYYNGARELTHFKIMCYQQTPAGGWGAVGQYTPDFLVLRRDTNNDIVQLLMVETKGAGFADQTGYVARKNYIQSHFLLRHAARFGYAKFDFIELIEPTTAAEQAHYPALLTALRGKLRSFFASTPANAPAAPP